MKIKILITICLVSFSSLSQNSNEIAKIINSYDQAKSIETQKILERARNEKRNRIESYIEDNPKTKITIYDDKKIYFLEDIINNNPVYVSNYNVESSEGTRTNFLQPGGEFSLNLEGEGINIGIWEVGGKTLTTHVEFQNNGNSKIIFSDSGNDVTYHSTHVSGTLVANGINPNAKGMAPKAVLKSYDTENSQSEASVEAAVNGLLISNHSYGIPVVGNNGPAPAWLMGAYNTSARNWDLIANSYPYYLSVFSAGNSGNDTYIGGLENGYDKLTGEKNSKNNLVVANASSVVLDDNGDVVFDLIFLNSSSSQGPSDDGRIKPDITGLGTNIFSTSNAGNNSYGVSTGTSMSAPNVAGSLVLLQELYFNEYGSYLKSATLKALALNTADDGGNIGPDAKFGWGLLNAKKAANTILEKDSQNTIIEEMTISNNEAKTFEVTASGNEKLKVMIVWNDPAGNSINNILNSSNPALINDLDLRVSNANLEYLPWKLNLDDVAAPATKGDNLVDNVEQVEIGIPVTGEVYTISINHKSSLVGGTQDYSIVVTGISASTLNNSSFNSESISVWPNPVKSQLNISNTATFNDSASASLYDLSGRLVKSLDELNSTENQSIDTSGLSKGIYILNITDGRQSIQKKIIKE